MSSLDYWPIGATATRGASPDRRRQQVRQTAFYKTFAVGLCGRQSTACVSSFTSSRQSICTKTPPALFDNRKRGGCMEVREKLARCIMPARQLNCLPMAFGWSVRGILAQRSYTLLPYLRPHAVCWGSRIHPCVFGAGRYPPSPEQKTLQQRILSHAAGMPHAILSSQSRRTAYIGC